MIFPRQRYADYLTLQLWRARVWMNQQRRLRLKQQPHTDIPPLLCKVLRMAKINRRET